MCGIAGVIAWDDRYRVNHETLRRMSARIAHRGPDGEGYYLNHEQEVTPDRPQCGFAFRRLAILDPDPRAMQPFTIGDKTIVFNGEIYNFRELRAELTTIRPDYAWRTTGDTEVLLLAYEMWGEKCPERLNGMFAFAVWDERDKSLFLARDRMGQKPLFVAKIADDKDHATIAFASELPALRAVPWVKYELEPCALKEYLSWGYVPNSMSWHTGIAQVHPSEWKRVKPQPGGPLWTSGGYFVHPPPREGLPSAPSDSSALRGTRELVRSAVRRQLVADVPLGCFLSGGVDSSVVTAAMSAAVAGGQKVMTFSIGFDDRRYDESQYAAAVARHLGTDHHSFHVRPDAAVDLPKLAAAFGEPFADSSALPAHYLARETRGHVTVALSGDGGDELFGGYDRYRAMALGKRARAITTPLPWIVLAPLMRRMPDAHPKSGWARARRFSAALGLPSAKRYAEYLRIFDEALLLDLFGREVNPGGDGSEYLSSTFRNQGRDLDVVRRAMAVDRKTYLPEDLLRKVDRTSMLHGLEVRSPFMDHELVQFAAGLTTDQLLKGGPKRMLREAFSADLPSWVFKRKKMGFAVPIGEWFRGELRPMLRDNLFAADAFGRQHFDMKVVERLVDEHETQKVDHSQRLYALLMLELWWRTTR